jgi:hypothetical protein
LATAWTVIRAAAAIDPAPQSGRYRAVWARSDTRLQAMVGRLDAEALAEILSATQLRSHTDDASDLTRLLHWAARSGVRQRITDCRAALRAGR